MPAYLEAEKTPFHSHKWLKSVEKIYRLDLHEFGAGNSRISFFYIGKMGRRLVSLPYCDFGGPVDDAAKVDFSPIKKKAGELNLDYIEIRDPGKTLEGQLEKESFVVGREYDAFSINLKVKKEVFWGAMDKKVRNSIRKAQKEGLTVNAMDDPKSFYKLYRITQKRLGSPHHPFSFFKEILDNCNHVMFFAKVEGKPVAASLFLFDGRKMYYWVNASNQKYMQMNPNDLIIHEAAMWGIDRDLDSLELGRSRPMEGTYFFKKKWATSSRQMRYYYKFYRKVDLQDKETRKYIIFRNMWGIAPAFLTNIIGPMIRKYFP